MVMGTEELTTVRSVEVLVSIRNKKGDFLQKCFFISKMLYICSVDYAQADSAIADWRKRQSSRFL